MKISYLKNQFSDLSKISCQRLLRPSRSLYRNLIRAHKVSQRKFEAAIFGVIVIVDRESDIERIAGEQTSLLATLGQMPAQGIESNGAAPLAVCCLPVVGGLPYVAATESRRIGIAARSCQYAYIRPVRP